MKKKSYLITLLAFMAWVSLPAMDTGGAEPTGEMKMDMPGEHDKGQVQDNRTEGANPQKSDVTKINQSSPLRGSKLIGMQIVNSSNEDLGSVEDIIIGPDGRIIYLIVAHGGVFGIGDRLTPVPYSVLDPGKPFKEGKVILDVSQKQLEEAPRIAGNEWPDFPDHEREVNAYYGARPSASGDGN